MIVVRAADAETRVPALPGRFVGDVWHTRILGPQEPSGIETILITYGLGAYSTWHAHPEGQVIVAVAGHGFIERPGEDPVALAPGDAVYAEPGEVHRHGASPSSTFVHLSMARPPADWVDVDVDASVGSD